MFDKKKDLIPIAAIAVFLVIILILCAVRLSGRNQKDDVLSAETVSVETVGTEDETQSETERETDPSRTSAVGEESTEKKTENEIPAGKEKEDTKDTSLQTAVRTISGNDPLAGAEGVNKTNEEMLVEMSSFWEQGNMEAVDDLAHLPWFMKMSAGIVDEDTFYYYGERNEQGQPNGLGIACYAQNEYYYGNWVNGVREGSGEWVKFYIYYDDDTVSDRAYQLHMYRGVGGRSSQRDGTGALRSGHQPGGPAGPLYPERDRDVFRRALQRGDVSDHHEQRRQPGGVERDRRRGRMEPLRSRHQQTGTAGVSGCGR